MGKRVQVIYDDDYDGSVLEEDEAKNVTIAVAVEGEEVEAWALCLSVKSLDAWRKATVKFLKDDLVLAEPVRLVVGTDTTASKTRSEPSDPRVPIIREWWRSLTPGSRVDLGLPGPPLPEPTAKGRIPAEVTAAYDKHLADKP